MSEDLQKSEKIEQPVTKTEQPEQPRKMEVTAGDQAPKAVVSAGERNGANGAAGTAGGAAESIPPSTALRVERLSESSS